MKKIKALAYGGLRKSISLVRVIRGLRNDEFLRVLENFPSAKHDDEVDGLSGAHSVLSAGSGAFSGMKDFFRAPGSGHSFITPERFHIVRTFLVRGRGF